MKKALLAVSVVVALSGCDAMCKKDKDAAPAAAAAPAASAPCASAAGSALAKINGREITDEDVRKSAGPKLQQAEMDLYDARKDAIDGIIDDQLIEDAAKKEGIAKADYLKKNVFDKIKIDDKEIEKFYNENKAQMQGKPLEELKGNIRGYLYRDKHQKVYGDLLAGLRKKANVAILISAPKVEVEEGDNPAIGPKDAPIKIVEFTDYQCPFCGKSRPTVNQILSQYKGKVRYVLRDFPLSFHKDSIKAHEGAHCAGDQDKYWEMNKKLFDNQRAIKVEDVKKYAEDLKLKMDKFNQCLDSDKYAEIVKQNQEYGEKVGVSGTPAFFINGRMVSGARPFSSFQEIIDDELRSNN
ncbi:MAG TPA: thioredoxin domain-containing protein [bacterium]|nr:thioredoxin domain-containing protein [bacterium]